MKKLVIGVDFDNTIANYDQLIADVAIESDYISSDTIINKKQIRDAIRLLPDGETKWRIVQGTVYGERMLEAKINKGVISFLKECRRRTVPIFIVSHKTEHADFDPTRTKLRQVALEWMEKQGFFSDNEIAIKRDNIFFESTRSEKIDRIARLSLSHFIDDLEETFQEPDFPSDVNKILYSQSITSLDRSSVEVKPKWHEIEEYFFDDNG